MEGQKETKTGEVIRTLSFLKEEAPVPDVEEGDVLESEIVDMKWPVESKYQNEDGTPRQQIELTLRLQTGFEFKSWLAFYERPSTKSKLGKLCQTLMGVTGIQYKSIKEFLDDLNKHGRVYVQVSGYRTWEDEEYPKFSVLSTKLPEPKKEITKTPTIAVSLQKVSSETVDFIVRSQGIIDMGLALNESDWSATVPVQVRSELLKNGLIEKKENLYFFTKEVAKFFQKSA
jgi:hypothetical protein